MRKKSTSRNSDSFQIAQQFSHIVGLILLLNFLGFDVVILHNFVYFICAFPQISCLSPLRVESSIISTYSNVTGNIIRKVINVWQKQCKTKNGALRNPIIRPEKRGLFPEIDQVKKCFFCFLFLFLIGIHSMQG